ncbi:MAG: PDZ domain-containing protein [Burkholderiales bacterium]|nr:PDZ domain-containing protein [Burkholderiales bacterium]
MLARCLSVLLVLTLVVPGAAWAGERGYFGFGFKIDGEGLMSNPTLRSATIEKVAPHSPAALAGMQVGDAVIEVAGQAIAGAKGKDIQAHIEKDIGETVQIKLRQRNGDMVVIKMVAAAKTW